MGKSSIAKVQYLHTNVTVLTAKYSSLGLSKLNFRFVENIFSPKWKYFFKPSEIFENNGRFGLEQRSIALKPHFAAPCQAKNKNRLLSKKRAPTPHRHRVSVENRLIHCTLQSTTDTLEKIRKTLGSSSILGQGLRHIVMSLFSLDFSPFSFITRETCSPPEPLGRWPVGEKQRAKGNFHK